MKKILTLVVLCVLSTPLYADTVTLNNGDKLTGTIIRKEDSNLIFNTSFAGDLTIKWSEIASLATDKPINIVLNNETSIEAANLSASSKGSTRIQTTDVNNPMEISLASVKFINPSIEVSGRGVKVSGRVNGGINIASGNTDTESYIADTEVIMRTKINRTTIGAKYYKAKESGIDTEDKSFAYLKYDHFLTDKRYIYGNTTFSRDIFKDQKLKSAVGIGYGHQFWESDARNLALEAGLSFVNDDFFIAVDENYTAARWAVNYDQKMYKNKIQFFHYHEGLMDLSESDNLTIISQTGFRFPLFLGMNAAIQANIDWDKSPPVDKGSTDRKILFSVGYAW